MCFTLLDCSDAGTGGATGPPSQYLADQLTLFLPEKADYPRLLLLAPQMSSPSGITDYHLHILFN